MSRNLFGFPFIMTIILHPNSERGLTRTSWLTSLHTFSFGNYYNPECMGFRTLRVINEDTVKPDSGFAPHSHRDMEIVTIVLKGTLTHQDSLGHLGTITSGEIQYMSAGTGIIHSEMNSDLHEEVHFLQIWLLPQEKGLAPHYQQIPFTLALNDITSLAQPHIQGKGIHLRQDATISMGLFEEAHVTAYPCHENHGYWIQIIEGELSVNEMILTPGDGISLEHQSSILLRANKKTVFLLFDLS